MELPKLIFRDVVALVFAIGPAFAKLIAFMPFLFLLCHLLPLVVIVLYLLDDVLDLLRKLMIGVLFLPLRGLLALLGRTDTHQASLEGTIPSGCLLPPRLALDLVCLQFVQLLLSLSLAHFLIVHQIHVVLNALCNGLAHESPRIRGECVVFLLLGGVVEGG